MAVNFVSLSAGDQRSRVASRAPPGDLSPSAAALALALASGDGFLVAAPEARLPGPVPRQAGRPSVRPESPARPLKGRDPDGRARSRQTRGAPYRIPAVKPHLLRPASRPDATPPPPPPEPRLQGLPNPPPVPRQPSLQRETRRGPVTDGLAQRKPLLPAPCRWLRRPG
ncbi:unnamed protein product [Nyctereutes procyonoides]|uniref:(raccoon dog) hypothetical protein n=1 Tax=Nyctereutes procyonoides TaxID=34880 RepID=A0A811ZMY5_NYCPR|nr:uncharacterized protein C11orf71 homolog [Nyctereutes procyonoides]CAD7689983.1 unnamed protein product [Nyctereutes procyonoides]